MFTATNSAVLLLAGLAAAAAQARSPSDGDIQFPAKIELRGELKEVGPGLSLMQVESLHLPARYVDSISMFYPAAGLALLARGSCLEFRGQKVAAKEHPTGFLAGARINLDRSACAAQANAANWGSRAKCGDRQPALPAGAWRLACRNLKGGRTALVAIGGDPPNAEPKVTIAVLNENVRFLGRILVHDSVILTTLGKRADGKTVISKYLWFPRESAKAVPPIYIGGREPHAASPWVQSTHASCEKNVISISGYGAAMPLDRPASIFINKRPPVGPALAQLLTDLSHRRAAYRLTVACGGSFHITLRIMEGEKQIDGTIRYSSAAAFFRGTRLVSYTGLQEANAETFWYR